MPLAGAALGCELVPPQGQTQADKAPGDNFYRLVVNGEIERYAPGQRYVGACFLNPTLTTPKCFDNIRIRTANRKCKK